MPVYSVLSSKGGAGKTLRELDRKKHPIGSSTFAVSRV